jgi:hypothetical protein
MNVVLRVIVGLATAAAVYFGLAVITLLIGGADCDKGECNFVGEAVADGTGKWLIAVAFLAVAAALGIRAARFSR